MELVPRGSFLLSRESLLIRVSQQSVENQRTVLLRPREAAAYLLAVLVNRGLITHPIGRRSRIGSSEHGATTRVGVRRVE